MKELIKINGKFVTADGGEVEWVEEESYFFKLSDWEKKLLTFYEKNKNFIKPISRRNEVINFVKSGLKDLSISRTSFKWGIKVPENDKHVVYVWIDALTNYLTALDFPNIDEKSKIYWKNSYHIIGKDILKFHAIYWPALLMAAEIDPPNTVFAHGWWTNEGKKISKSFGNIINPLNLISKFGLDQLKYFILREVTLGQDGDFSEKAFISRINSDLSNSLGNLVSRSLKFNNKYFNNKFPTDITLKLSETEILRLGYSLFDEFEKKIINFEINKGMEILWNFIDKLNQFIDKMKPWDTIKDDKQKTAETMALIIESIRLIAIMLQPFIPDSANKLLNILNINSLNRDFKFLNFNNSLKKNHEINDPEQLFPRYNV